MSGVWTTGRWRSSLLWGFSLIDLVCKLSYHFLKCSFHWVENQMILFRFLRVVVTTSTGHTRVCVFSQMVFLGFMVCGVLSGYVADRYGRWKVKHVSVFSHTHHVWRHHVYVYVCVCVCVCVQVVFGGFVWSAYFSLLTSFAPSYGWFIFLRSMVGCGVAGVSQGLADAHTHTHTHTHIHTLTHTHTLSHMTQQLSVTVSHLKLIVVLMLVFSPQ